MHVTCLFGFAVLNVVAPCGRSWFPYTYLFRAFVLVLMAPYIAIKKRDHKASPYFPFLFLAGS